MKRQLSFFLISFFVLVLFPLQVKAESVVISPCQVTADMGDSLNGTWGNNCLSERRIDHRDPYNPRGYPTRFFTFELERDADVRISIFGGYGRELFLINGESPSGETLLSFQNSLIETWLPQGTYTVEATASSYSNFTINFSYNDVGSEECVQSLEENQTLSDGWIQACESQNRDYFDPYSPLPDAGFRAKYFTFTLDQSSDIQIDIESVVNHYVYILQGTDEFGVPIHQSSSKPVLLTLDAGDYTIELTTIKKYSPGQFNIKWQQLLGDQPCEEELMLDQVTSGIWSSACPIRHWDDSNQDPYAGSNPRRANYYSFEVTENLDLEFIRRSSDSNLLMNLYKDDVFGELVGTNVSGRYWSHYMESSFKAKVTPGKYLLEVTKYNQVPIGNYQIETVTLGSGDCTTAIALGGHSSSLISHDCTSAYRQGDISDPYGPRPGDYYSRNFEFTLTESTPVNLIANFSDESGYLYLYTEKNGERFLLDESFSASAWSSTRYPRITRELEPGTYILEVTTHYPDREGDFSVSLSRSYSVSTCLNALEMNRFTSRQLSRECESEFKDGFWVYDPYGPNGGANPYYAKSFTFYIEKEGMYEVGVGATDFNSHLFLANGANTRGDLLLEQPHSGSAENVIEQWLTPGYYTLEVTTDEAKALGTFSVYVSDGEDVVEGEIAECSTRLHLDYSQTIESDWQTGCIPPEATIKTSSHYYNFTVPDGDPITFGFETDYSAEAIILQKLSAPANWETLTRTSRPDLSLQTILEPGDYRIHIFSFDINSDNPVTATVTSSIQYFGEDYDADGDGIPNVYDKFPLDPAEFQDSDGDSIGNNQDPSPYPAGGIVKVESSEYTVGEDAGTVQVTVTRDHYDPSSTLRIYYYTEDLTATAYYDYSANVGSAIFEPGENRKVITIEIKDDQKPEITESLRFRLGKVEANGLLYDTNQATINIEDNDPLPEQGAFKWTVKNSEIGEGKTITLVVERVGDDVGVISVDYLTQDTSQARGAFYATANEDYSVNVGTLTFADGQKEAEIVIDTLDDSLLEEDKSFTVLLSNPTGGAIVLDPETTVKIIDNDLDTLAPYVKLASENISFQEADGTVPIHIERINGTTGVVRLNWRVQELSAKRGLDFNAKGGMVVIPEGENTAAIPIELLDNDRFEPTRSFLLYLDEASNGVQIAGNSRRIVNISEDDSPSPGGVLEFSSNEYQVDETAGFLTATINRLYSDSSLDSVVIEVIPGTAESNLDLMSEPLTLSFQAGENSKTVEIPIIDDDVSEPKESFALRISVADEQASITERSSAIVTINDNEPLDDAGHLQFSGSTYSFSESHEQTQLTVIRTNGNHGVVSVQYKTVVTAADQTPAQAGVDFASTQGTITFADGQVEALIPLKIMDNNRSDGERAFDVILEQAEGTILGETPRTTVIIRDDEQPPEPRGLTSKSGGSSGSIGVWVFVLVFFTLLIVRFREFES